MATTLTARARIILSIEAAIDRAIARGDKEHAAALMQTLRTAV